MGFLQKEMGHLVIWDVEKAVFTVKCSSHTTKMQKGKAETEKMKNHPLEKIRFKTM